MFKEQNERKENTVQIDVWTKRPCVPLSFDDLDQYLSFMQVWSSDWSSCDPGHMERTDFSDEVGFVPNGNVDDIDEPVFYGVSCAECGTVDADELDGIDGEFDSFDNFLMKDRSLALRRRSTALHKFHKQETWAWMSKKAVQCVRPGEVVYNEKLRQLRKDDRRYVKTVSEVLSDNTRSDRPSFYELPSVKPYVRVRFPRGRQVEFTTLYDELDSMVGFISVKELANIFCSFSYDDCNSLEVSRLCSSEHTVSKAPVFSKRARHYKKYAGLYARKVNHNDELVDERKKLEEECMKLADKRNKLARKCKELKKELRGLANDPSKSDLLAKELKELTKVHNQLVAERKELKRLITGNVSVSESAEATAPELQEARATSSGKEHFDGRHIGACKSNAPVLPVKMSETKMPVVLAKPQCITLIFPHVSTAGLPFRR